MSRGLLTVMATVTHLGLVVLTAGLLFYVTDREVIVERDAGALLGPTMVLASMATVFLVLARGFGTAERDGRTEGPRILVSALVATAVSYVAMLAVGGIRYALVRDEAVWVVLFAGRYAGSPFVVLSCLWAGVTVAGFLVLARVDDAR